VSALSFVNAEALERFSEASPGQACEQLEHHPDLESANSMAMDFGAHLAPPPGS